jgi:hypothetical protein
MKSWLVFVLTLVTLFGCKSKWERQLEQQIDDMNSLKAAISADQGGAVIEISKISGSGTERYVVFKNTTTGEYMAYNMTKWSGRTMTSLSQYIDDGNDVIRDMERKEEWVVTGHYEDITEYQWVTKTEWVTEYEWVTRNEWDSFCECYRDNSYYEPVSQWKTTTNWENVVVGQRYVDDSGYYPFYYGGGFRFENAGSASRDLDTRAAILEEMGTKGLALKLQSDYSLSSERADVLAGLALKRMKMESQRALTASEKNSFAMEALGVSMAQVEHSIKQRALGNDGAYEELLKEAAQVNHTSPETIGRFFDEMME